MLSAYLPTRMVTLILSRQDSNSVPSLFDPRHCGFPTFYFYVLSLEYPQVLFSSI